jgi:hypothetical protein
MKKYRFLTPAILELEAASQFYETNRPDLGREFLDKSMTLFSGFLQTQGRGKYLTEKFVAAA